MKSLDKYISEAGGFFGNTKTSKTDLVMEWIYKYIFYTNKKIIPPVYKINEKGGNISVIYSGIFKIGESTGPMLNGMPPINLISNYNYTFSRELQYNCEIKKFGVPLNIDDYDTICLNQISSMVENPDIFNQTCKVINDCKSINCIYFDLYNTSKVNKNTTNYKSYDKGFKELKRDFNTIAFNDKLFRIINFNQDIKVNAINIHKSDKKVELLPKIISLPICKNLYFENLYNYNEIIEMLSDYVPNPNINDIDIYPRRSDKELENIKNIILGKK